MTSTLKPPPALVRGGLAGTGEVPIVVATPVAPSPALPPVWAGGGAHAPGGLRGGEAASPPGRGQAVIAARMSEAALDAQIRQMASDLGLLRYHTFSAKRSPSGFPDLVLVGRGVLYRELKTQRGKVSKAQGEWLRALVLAGEDACVWRPSDLMSGLIARKLAALAGIGTRNRLHDGPDSLAAQSGNTEAGDGS